MPRECKRCSRTMLVTGTPEGTRDLQRHPWLSLMCTNLSYVHKHTLTYTHTHSG